MRKTFFLDRDGTINEEIGFLHEVEKVKILEGVAEGIKRAREKGYLIIVISNQSGIGRGYFREEDVKKVNERINEILSKEGAEVDAFYYCPHSPEENCSCRKPKPGLFLKAIKDWDIDIFSSINVGDSLRDIEAGIRAGVKKNFLVLTGKGKEQVGLIKSFPYKVKVIKKLSCIFNG